MKRGRWAKPIREHYSLDSMEANILKDLERLALQIEQLEAEPVQEGREATMERYRQMMSDRTALLEQIRAQQQNERATQVEQA